MLPSTRGQELKHSYRGGHNRYSWLPSTRGQELKLDSAANKIFKNLLPSTRGQELKHRIYRVQRGLRGVALYARAGIETAKSIIDSDAFLGCPLREGRN